MLISRTLTVLILLLMLGAHAALADDKPKGAALVLAKMEAAMMKLKNRKLKFSIESTGAIATAFNGEIVFKKDNVIDYRTAGKFAGKDQKLFLMCDGKTLRGGSEAKPFEMAAPTHLRQGILIGMARMGLLHNIARMTGNQPPERTDGTVTTWLAADNISFVKEEPVDAPRPAAVLKLKGKSLTVVFFDLAVDGKKKSGEVELWVDNKTNLPYYRAIIVNFPNGKMFVTEKYEWEKL